MPGNILTDSKGRPVRYIRVSVTDRCNLRCRYCAPSAEFVSLLHSQVLSYEEIERVAAILAPFGVTSVRLTGGEPLVRKHIDRLIGSLARTSGIEDLSLTTNGILLAEHARALKEAGLLRVNVSLDSLKPDRFRWITNSPDKRRKENLGSVLEGLEEAQRVGLAPVKVNVVLMRGLNDDEVGDFVDLTREGNLEVRFIEFMPMGPNGFWNRDRVVPADEVIGRIMKSHPGLEHVGKSKGSGPAVLHRIPGHRGSIGFITPVSSHFCAHCNRVRLTADGKLRTCLFSDTETDLLPLIRGGASDEQILGTIRQALLQKPDGHRISARGALAACARTMSHIGG
ncbi:MAG: GTP 3',8-cyclase MoaA [bacterium]|nr:MAG: GTP 3',8-cyclase MoaA [bacterium]